MLVLGRKYKFTQHELKRLRKKFHNITIVRYIDREQEIVLKELENSIESREHELLVLNTRAQVGDGIIKYLTNLQFEKRNKKIKIITIEHFMEEYLHKCYIPDDHKELNFLEDIKPFNFFEYNIKRIIDIVGVCCLFVVFVPVMVYAIRKIKKESPGSYIFRQTRTGVNGKLFYCNKFRSMHENSYHDPYTRENDSRIFPFGRIMRKTRIDELPQILNVLKGDMHLIGPRAEWNILVENYEKEIPYYNERHLVRPGITGWAQVMYPYGANAEDAKQKLMYDLYYIKHWTVMLECKVIWKTIGVIIGKQGI